MLCIWLNNVSRLVFWQPPKCWSSAREVAKLFACFNKYNSHFWRYPKMSLGNWQQLWQLLSGRKAEKRLKSMSERDSLLINYIIFILAMLWTVFFLCWLSVVNIDATVVMWRRHWRHLQLEPETVSLSVCLPVCLPVYQFLRPAGHSWADDVNSGRRFEYAWRGLEDVVAVVDFFHAFHVQRDHSMAT